MAKTNFNGNMMHVEHIAYATSSEQRIDARPAKNRLLRRHMRPVLFVLTCLGMGRLGSRFGKPLNWLYTLVSFVVVAVDLFVVTRLIWLMAPISSFSESNCYRIAIITWSLQVVVAALTSLYVHHKGYLKQLWRLAAEVDADDMMTTTGCRRRFQRVSVLMNVATVLYSATVLSRHILAHFGIMPDVTPQGVFFSSSSQLLMIGVSAQAVLVWFGLQLMYMVTCNFVEKSWTALSVMLTIKRRQENVDFEQLTDWMLFKHGRLLALNRILGDMFGAYAFLQLCSVVPTLIVDLYVVFTSSEKMLRFNLIMWSMSAVLQLCVICYGAYVRSAACLTRNVFYEYYIEQVTGQTLRRSDRYLILLQKAGLLMQKLDSPDVGIDICDLFLLTKPFFFTMISMIFNYFFLLVQFALDDKNEIQLTTATATTITTTTSKEH